MATVMLSLPGLSLLVAFMGLEIPLAGLGGAGWSLGSQQGDSAESFRAEEPEGGKWTEMGKACGVVMKSLTSKAN